MTMPAHADESEQSAGGRRRVGPAIAKDAWGYAEISAAISQYYDPRRVAIEPLRVLEAGGGSDSWLDLPAGAEITTIDISAEQLAMNTYAREKLLGDLQDYDYGSRRFDLIICWDVLEHLQRPADAIERMAAALAPGGRLLLKGPLPHSLKGLVTRFTPHAVHVLFYRWVLGSRQAGRVGHPPFAAYLAPGSGPREISRLLAKRDITVDVVQVFESTHVAAIARKGRLLHAAYRACDALAAMLLRGDYQRGVTDFFLIARRS